MMKILLRCAFVVLVLGVMGCSSGVNWDYDQLADFSKYRSFNWLPVQDTSDSYQVERVKRAIVLNLTQRGYLQGGAAPTLLISIKINDADAPEILELTMIDAETSRRIWDASTQFYPPQNQSPSDADKKYQDVVGKLLRYFPPDKD